MSLFELPVGNYLEELASNSPAPGGGTAAALSGAQGAGLVRMVAELTLPVISAAMVLEPTGSAVRI